MKFFWCKLHNDQVLYEPTSATWDNKAQDAAKCYILLWSTQ